MSRIAVLLLTLVLAVAGVVPAAAEPVAFRIHKNYSQASFRSDAPLETFVGTAAIEGTDGSLTVDPARPQDARGIVKIDMNRVSTGIERRDADMRSKNYLETEIDANRWVTFEIKRVEMAGPLTPGKETAAKVHGVLTIKQKPVERVAEATVLYMKLTPEQLEQQKRFGFTGDNIKVKAKLTTTFTDHGMQVPQLLFLKVANQLELNADIVFVRAQ